MIIGIDLGTTTSAMSYYKNGKTEIIPNAEGKRMTDSVVALDRHGNIIVGEQAKRVIGTDKIEEVKRLMGSDRKIKLGEKEYLPEEISAEILKKLKKDAEDFLGQYIHEAVITVPAMFTSSQKAATIKAGELAGFKVERIITEPTAAAMAYGISNMQEKQKILVYDFGGGTFDVSILELEEGILDVISTSGDNYLGGKDIDEIILRNLDIDINQDNKYKIKLEIEEIKKRLSFNESVDIIIPEFKIDLEVTRSQFEKWIEPIIDKTIDFSKQALKNIKLVEDDIDIVLLVGGSTRIPLVQKKLKEIFGEKVKKVGDPQEMVALGAGVQAAIKEDLISSETGLIVTDVCNYSLGVSCIGEYQGMIKSGVYSVIIPKLSSLPCLKSEIYYTSSDNQDSVNVQVYQGEEYLVENNIFLKSFVVDGIPKNKAGSEKIKISFAYSINDILEVEVEILSTGEKKKVSLEVNENKISEKKKNYKNSKYYSDYKVILDLAEEKIKKASENDKAKIREIVQKMKEKLIEENIEELEKLDGILTDILFEV